MAQETINGKYKYTNRVKASLDPHIKNKILAEKELTGESESAIVARALEQYFERQRAAVAVSKHSY